MNKRSINLILAAFIVLGFTWFSPIAKARNDVEDNVMPPTTQSTDTTSVESETMPTTEPVLFKKIDSKGKLAKPLSKTEVESLSTEKKDTLIQEIKDQNKTRVEQKLDDAKKKICENKKEGIQNAMDKISQVGKKHGDWLDGVVTKVKAFVTKNTLTVDNYDTLLATVDNSSAAVDAAVATLDTYKGQFDCSTDPKGVSTDFKTVFQVLKDAEKAYKEAVRALLEATKTAAKSAAIAPTTKSNSQSTTTGGTQ